MTAPARGIARFSGAGLFTAGATAALFFASGFAALIYQIVWQRSLFTIFGINVEAVTVVVSGFIAGLGLGNLVGGWLSRTLRGHLLLVFGVIEIAIGLIGALSLQLFEWVGVRTLLLPAAAIAAGTIGVILLPTLLMGATLPILTQHLIHRRQNVGWSVGLLYSANTFGSATAGFASAFWLMGALGMQGAVLLAATVNLTVGLTALLVFYGSINSDSFPSSTYERAAAEQRPSPSLNLVAIALGVSALTGYIALSYEVLWFRAFLVATNRAPAFALILATYLTGVAIGSYGAREYCASRPTNQQLMFILSLVILLSSAIGFLVLPLAAKLAAGGMGFFVATILALVVIQTSVAGAVLPLICHSLTPPGPSTGIWVSSVYAANIFGSVVGTLITGFLLMDVMSTLQISVLLTELGAVAALAVGLLARASRARQGVCLATAVLMAVAVPVTSDKLFDHYYERLIYKEQINSNPAFVHVLENKSGVITINADGIVYGGGIYDGRVSIDLFDDKNLLIRPFSLALFHGKPREVLLIGLSMGAWAQVLANHPEIERLTIVEINPGYVALIRQYPALASLLDNPKVEIIVDDGRRWLNRNPTRTFDMIVQNSSWWFRPNITNLISIEYLRLAAQHLREGGIMMYNTNYSARAMLTGCTVFPGGVRELNLIVGGPTPTQLNHQRLRQGLKQYEIDGHRVIDTSDPKQSWHLDQIMFELQLPTGNSDQSQSKMETCESVRARASGLPVVTDDNMGEEWR